MSKKLAEVFYQQRAFWGNIFVFVGFLAAIFDPRIHITLARLLLGFVLASLGFALRIWASGYVWPNIAQLLPEARSGLITAGPYAYVRNPIYLGAILMISGICASLGSWWITAVMIIPTVFMHLWHSHYEERYMIHRFGQTFLDYKSQVPRFVPKFWSPYPSRQGEFSWDEGIKSDIGPLSAFIMFFAAMALHLLLFQQSPKAIGLLLVLVGATLASFVVVFVVRRHAY